MAQYGNSNLPVTQYVRVRNTAQTSNGTSNYLTGFIVEAAFVADDSNVDSLIPALGSSFGAPYANALLTESNKEPYKAGLSRVTLTYTAQAQSTPPTTYTEQSSQIEVPIQEHPDFLDWTDELDDEGNFLSSSSKFGITSYIKGSTTVTVRSYYTSKPSSDRGDIGTIQSPGSDYSESGHWLLVGSNRSLQGAFWVKENNYLYSAKAWNSDVYGS